MRHKDRTNQKTGRPFCAPLAHDAPVSCECHSDCHVLARVIVISIFFAVIKLNNTMIIFPGWSEVRFLRFRIAPVSKCASSPHHCLVSGRSTLKKLFVIDEDSTWRHQGCNLWRNRVKMLSFSEQLIKPYSEGMRRTRLGYWRCGISYGWNLTTCGSRYRNLAPPFASARDAAGTLPGPRRATNRMEVTWLNCATGYNPGRHVESLSSGRHRTRPQFRWDFGRKFCNFEPQKTPKIAFW